jgi:hypothetical protein
MRISAKTSERMFGPCWYRYWRTMEISAMDKDTTTFFAMLLDLLKGFGVLI